MAPPRGFPYAFDRELNSGGSIIAGELYSVSTHLTVISVVFAGRPKLHLSQQFSSFYCESFVMFRRRVSFAYLVQAEGEFDDHLLRSDDSVVLQLQWRHRSPCKTCVFFPNSTVNAGRNHLLESLLSQFPSVHFNFVVFMDEDAKLLMRGDGAHDGSRFDAHREYERLLLQWQPAIGVPFHSWHNLQEHVAVQTVDHFDHIVVALHDEVVDYFLPTETRFDSICWWHGQAIYSVISSMFFPNNTLQFNTIISINTGARSMSLEGVAETSSKYKKRTDFYPALMWILSSAKALPLLSNVDITVNASSFTYGTLSNKGNRYSCTCLLPAYTLHALISVTHFPRFAVAPSPSGGYQQLVRHLAGLVDCCHPYWMKVQADLICLFVNSSHSSQHGFRTLYAGPQSLWNPDVSANDWLMQVALVFFFIVIPIISFVPAVDLQHELLRIFCSKLGM
jgi:hypothetical protein